MSNTVLQSNHSQERAYGQQVGHYYRFLAGSHVHVAATVEVLYSKFHCSYY